MCVCVFYACFVLAPTSPCKVDQCKDNRLVVAKGCKSTVVFHVSGPVGEGMTREEIFLERGRFALGIGVVCAMLEGSVAPLRVLLRALVHMCAAR